MSKAAKQSIFILIFLIVASLGYAGYITFEKKKVEDAKLMVEEELEQTQQRETQKIREVKQLKDEVEKGKDEKVSLEGRIRSAEKQVKNLKEEVSKITDDRDTWKRRIDKVTKERDALTSKVKKSQRELSSFRKKSDQETAKLREELTEKSKSVSPKFSSSSSRNTRSSREISVYQSSDNEEYWASLLREKAELEIEVEQLKSDLAEKSIDIVELRQNSADMQIELDRFKHERDEMNEEIKYKGDLINNLSLELARTKNDKKFVANRIIKLNDENTELRQNLKQLVSSKGALEKSIVRLTQDKNKIERELGKSESLIQSKIDEIWEIKESLDQTFKDSMIGQLSSREIELPPIIVSSDGRGISFNTGASEPGFYGRIVSINEENNFVILDIGKSTGIQLGEMISVYRDSKYIARLEVIQIRQDICAADVKDQWSRIKVGDIVR